MLGRHERDKHSRVARYARRSSSMRVRSFGYWAFYAPALGWSLCCCIKLWVGVAAKLVVVAALLASFSRSLDLAHRSACAQRLLQFER